MDEKIVEQASQSFMEYGILGILVFIMGYILYNTYKRLVKKNDELEKKIDILQEEMISMLSSERDRMAQLVAKNTEALNELSRVILEYIVKKD
jgi:hypothetical protein